MRKRKKHRKFHRKRDQRRALLKSLARELFLHGKIKTTLAKAKELKSFSERFIEKSKEKNLTNLRYLRRFFDKKVVKKLFEEIGPKYKERKGGYTRIIKLGPRESDGAEMAIIELV
ncbi:50S ribosomal protein L17 [Candidatus Parcubacteria bacterium]|nr:50S ribosomal protein L17 [Candidatus Parcubacteria bacterium]